MSAFLPHDPVEIPTQPFELSGAVKASDVSLREQEIELLKNQIDDDYFEFLTTTWAPGPLDMTEEETRRRQHELEARETLDMHYENLLMLTETGQVSMQYVSGVFELYEEIVMGRYWLAMADHEPDIASFTREHRGFGVCETLSPVEEEFVWGTYEFDLRQVIRESIEDAPTAESLWDSLCCGTCARPRKKTLRQRLLERQQRAGAYAAFEEDTKVQYQIELGGYRSELWLDDIGPFERGSVPQLEEWYWQATKSCVERGFEFHARHCAPDACFCRLSERNLREFNLRFAGVPDLVRRIDVLVSVPQSDYNRDEDSYRVRNVFDELSHQRLEPLSVREMRNFAALMRQKMYRPLAYVVLRDGTTYQDVRNAAFAADIVLEGHVRTTLRRFYATPHCWGRLMAFFPRVDRIEAQGTGFTRCRRAYAALRGDEDCESSRPAVSFSGVIDAIMTIAGTLTTVQEANRRVREFLDDRMIHAIATLMWVRSPEQGILALGGLLLCPQFHKLSTPFKTMLMAGAFSVSVLGVKAAATIEKERFADWAEAQGLSFFEGDDSVIGILGRLKGASMVTRALAVVALLLAAIGFGEDSRLIHFLRGSVDYLSGKVSTSLPVMLLDFAERCAATYRRYMETGNPWDLLGCDSSAAALLDIERCSNRVIASLTGKQVLSSEILMSETQRILTKYKAETSPVVKKALMDLMALRTRFASSRDKTRALPVGVIIRGPPGTGKSTFSELLAEAVRREMNLPGEDVVFEYLPDQDFQKLPAYRLIFSIQDFFTTRDEYNVEGALGLLQRAVDSTLMDVNTASLDEKACSSMANQYAVITTNTSKFKLSRATCGANKLDRRYLLVVIIWSDKAIQAFAVGQFAAGEMTLEILHERYPEVPTNEWTVWTIGYMKNDPSSIELDLTIREKSRVITGPAELVVILMTTRKAKLAAAAKRKAVPVEFCDGGYPLPHAEESCTSCAAKAQLSAATLKRAQEWAAYIEDDLATWGDSIVAQGQSSSAPRNYDWPLAEEGDDDVERSPEGLFSAPPDASTWVSFQAWCERRKVACALVVVCVALPMAASLLRSYYGIEAQAHLVGSVVDLEPTSEYVAPYCGGNVPWLGSVGDLVLRVDIVLHSGREAATAALLLTPTVFCCPAHIFAPEGPSFKRRMTSHDIDGVRMTYSYGDVTCPLKMSPDMYHLVPESDLLFVFVSLVGSAVRPLYDMLLPSGGATPGATGMIVDRPVTFRSVNTYTGLETAAGDCGKPIWLFVTPSVKSLVGFHHGYSTKRGFALFVPLNLELVDAVFAEHARKSSIPVFLPGVDVVAQGAWKSGLHPATDFAQTCEREPSRKETLLSDYVVLGHVPSNNTQTMTCSTTRFTEKLLATGLVRPHGKPNAGHAKFMPKVGSWVSAVTLRLDTTTREKGFIDGTLMRKCVIDAVDYLPKPSAPLVPYSRWTVLLGRYENSFVNARDNDKAVGYVLGQKRVNKKNAFVETFPGSQKWVMHPEVAAAWDYADKVLASGRTIVPVAMATVKDEALPLESIDKGKARLFYVVDLVYNLQLKQYLLPLIAHELSNPTKSAIFAAINPGSSEWASLRAYLTQWGRKVVDTDQKKYDLHHEVIIQFCVLYTYLLAKHLGYTDEDAKKAALLVRGGFRYVLGMEGNFFFVDGKLCSGYLVTLWINSIIGKLLTIYMYYTMCGVSKKWYLELAMALVGDDNLTACKNAAFNPAQVAELMALMGYEVTAGDKSANIGWVDIESVLYLKRGFSTGDKYVLCPLVEESILKPIAYQTGKLSLADIELTLVNAFCVAAREFFFHGRERYAWFVAFAAECGYMVRSYESFEKLYVLGAFKSWEVSARDACRIGDPFASELGPHSPDSGIFLSAVETGQASHQPLLITEFFGEELNEAQGLGTFADQRTKAGTPEVRTDSPAELNTDSETTLERLTAPVTEIAALNVDKVAMRSPFQFEDHDENLALSRFFERPRLVHTLVFDNSSTADSLVANFCLQPQVQSILEQYGQARYDELVFGFQYTGSSSYTGACMLSFMPVQGSTLYNRQNAHDIDNVEPFMLSRASQTPNLILDASAACSCEIALPWTEPYEYKDIKGTSALLPPGWVLNQLLLADLGTASGASADPVTIDVYLSFRGVKLRNLVAQSEYGSRHQKNSKKSFIDSVMAKIPKKMPVKLSEWVNFGGAALEAVGLARPPEDAQEALLLRRQTCMSAFSGQPMMVDTLGADPRVVRPAYEGQFPLEQPGDTTLAFLKAKWSIHRRKVAVEEPVYCTPGHTRDVVDSGFHFWDMTALNFLTTMFDYWRGTLHYKLVWYSSPLVRVRFGIVVQPPGEIPATAFVTDGSCVTYIVDVVGTTEFEFDVPYMNEETWKLTGRTDQDNLPDTCPIFTIFKIAGPFGPAGSPPTPQAIVWIRGGTDFEVGIPSLVDIANWGIVAQSEGDPVGGRSVQSFGEVYEDLKALTQRSEVNTTFTHGTSTNQSNLLWPVYGMMPIHGYPASLSGGAVTFSPLAWSWVNYITTAYMGYSGSFVHRFTAQQDSSVLRPVLGARTVRGTNGYLATNLTHRTQSGRGAGLFDMANGIGEVRTLYRDNGLFTPRLPLWYYGTGSFDIECLALVPVGLNNQTATRYTSMAISAGDDFRFGGYLCPPKLVQLT